MKRLLLLPVLVLATFATPASAARPCERGVDVNCSNGGEICVVYVAVTHRCAV